MFNNFFSVIAFNKISSGKDNILFSNYGETNGAFSGFRFGISMYGYPYIEYYDNNLGPLYFSHTDAINLNMAGITYFGLNSANNFFIGSYSYEDNLVIEQSCNWNASYNISNSAYVGGDPDLVAGKYLSGYINEFVIYETMPFKSFNKALFASGIAYDIIETTTTGVISGQTGILYGDIINIKQYISYISGTGIIFDQSYTGIDYYLPGYQEFLDFNSESFSNYYYSGVSGISFSESLYGVTGIIVSLDSITGYEFYEYDSGYKIEYSIKDISIVLKKPEYLYYAYNGIKVNFDLNSGDIICAFYQQPTGILNIGTNYNFLSYDYISNTYYDNQVSNRIKSLYYNGQYQRYSSGYNNITFDGSKYLSPEDDFLVFNSNIFSNSGNFVEPYYGNNSGESFLIGDLWLGSGNNYILNTGMLSGQYLNNVNFTGSFVFLNGQLLTSGKDYKLPNQILFDIKSGENIISVNKTLPQLKYFQHQIDYNSNNKIYFNDDFIENTTLIWLNGVRLINNTDYIEI